MKSVGSETLQHVCYTHLQTADLKGREQGNTFTVFQEEEGGVIRLWPSPGSGAVWHRHCLFNPLNMNKGSRSVFTFIIYEWQVNKKLSHCHSMGHIIPWTVSWPTYVAVNVFHFNNVQIQTQKSFKYYTVMNPWNIRHLAFSFQTQSQCLYLYCKYSCVLGRWISS